MAARRNPPWTREELILALDLYFRHPPSAINQQHPAVVQLSEELNRFKLHAERPNPDVFRNPNGVYMKLCNFLRFDPGYTGIGLTRGNRLEGDIWEEFARDRGSLADEAKRIRNAGSNS
jgi:5-methylcytosine-specific restriction enzyme A